MIIDGMMHLEVYGDYWDGLIDEVIEHYDKVGVDKGLVLTTWTESRESNDRTLMACRKYPDRFLPCGHVRPQDAWEDELKRITQELGWTSLKLHQGELSYGGGDIEARIRTIMEKAIPLGIRMVKLHFVNYDAMERLTREFSQVTWILPHLGCYQAWDTDLERYCRLARERRNVYLDTSAVAPYYLMGKAIAWAGADKITWASDGYEFSVMVEKSIIDTLRLPTPFRTPTLSDEDYDKIMGRNMVHILGLTQ